MTQFRSVLPRTASYRIVLFQVGSGKSSLLAAVLGEMSRVGGRVAVRGRVAYTAQDPWIQNSTLRANVLMGEEMDEVRGGTFAAFLGVICCFRRH